MRSQIDFQNVNSCFLAVKYFSTMLDSSSFESGKRFFILFRFPLAILEIKNLFLAKIIALFFLVLEIESLITCETLEKNKISINHFVCLFWTLVCCGKFEISSFLWHTQEHRTTQRRNLRMDENCLQFENSKCRKQKVLFCQLEPQTAHKNSVIFLLLSPSNSTPQLLPTKIGNRATDCCDHFSNF